MLSCLPGENPVSTHEARQGSSQKQGVEGGRVGLPDLWRMGSGISQGSKQKRKMSRDWHSEPRIKASQAASELVLTCSLQGTSGGLVLSLLFPAASPTLPALCQTLNSECLFLTAPPPPSSLLEEAESCFSSPCRS